MWKYVFKNKFINFLKTKRDDNEKEEEENISNLFYPPFLKYMDQNIRETLNLATKTEK